jgi:hypothetical protein
MTDTQDVILEPGDHGYVPSAEPVPEAEPGEVPNVVVDPTAVPGEAGEDLTHVQQPGESDAEFAARTRGVVVDSQSPTDIVPNMPQTTMGERVQVEGSDPPVYVGVPPETLEPEVPLEEEPVEDGEEPPAEEPASA